MDERDYILREIERLGSMLARIRDRILGRTTSLEEVKRDLHAAARGLGVDLETARTVTPETLAMVMSAGGSVEPTQCWLLGESLYLAGLEARLSGSVEEGEALLLRARVLYQLLEDGNIKLVHVTEAGERLAEIDAILAAPPDARLI
jgi:hypothetical protein